MLQGEKLIKNAGKLAVLFYVEPPWLLHLGKRKKLTFSKTLDPI
jgi:hypothetical protein